MGQARAWPWMIIAIAMGLFPIWQAGCSASLSLFCFVLYFVLYFAFCFTSVFFVKP